MKKKFKAVFCLLLAIVVFCSLGLQSFAFIFVETQYSYDSQNLSWLKDLIVKEDMTTVGGLSERVKYTPKSDYPYRETAETFSEEISYYYVLYTLDEDMGEVAYLYLLDIAETFAGVTASSDYSDESIRSYLEGVGIVYPEGEAAESSETKIVARALFSIITKDDSYVITEGTGLYQAFTSYLSTLLGINGDVIPKFDNDGVLSDLKDYVLAACKYLLYAEGYKVDASTSDEEVYRLLAIMIIRSQGISIDSGSATFPEIKTKYLAAMMGKIYDVQINPNDLDEAAKNGETALYMLKLIGKKNGVTVGDSLSYEDAFKLVCEKTDYFNLEDGEFYADIFEYDLSLKYKRDRIWIYPETLGVTDEDKGTAVSVTVNGSAIKDNYYSDIKLDSAKAREQLVITVQYTDENFKKTSSSYKLNITQGKEKAPESSFTLPSALSGVAGVVEQLLGEVGLDSSFANIVKNIPFELPERFLNVSELLIPNFSPGGVGSGALDNSVYSQGDDSNVDSGHIGGVGGLDSFNNNGDDSALSLNFSTGNVNPGVVTPPQTVPVADNPADELLVDPPKTTIPASGKRQTLTVSDNSDWFKDFMNDTPTVIVLAVVLVVAFAVCFILFSKIIKESSQNGDRRD